MNEGRLVSSRGRDIAIDGFEAHFIEYQEAHSTALYCRNQGQNYRAPTQSASMSNRAPAPAGAAPKRHATPCYDLDAAGKVTRARIEAGLRQVLQGFGLDQDDASLRRHGETAIRNYDPRISCATHFLDLRGVWHGNRSIQTPGIP